MYIGGLGSMRAASSEEATGGTACPGERFCGARGEDDRLLQSVTGACRPQECDWDEIMLPLVGPEIWRLPVEEPERTRNWIRGWVDFNFCRGAAQGSTGMRRAGLRTPVEVRSTPLGTCLKFMPAGSRKAGVGFDGLSEGAARLRDLHQKSPDSSQRDATESVGARNSKDWADQKGRPRAKARGSRLDPVIDRMRGPNTMGVMGISDHVYALGVRGISDFVSSLGVQWINGVLIELGAPWISDQVSLLGVRGSAT
ncbi:unnamed protein product [Prorocentrum cordatum]|uniref:Uncharacterized protein n=1 Tax=Prorocentrum cordatum TaxID=2364126 RepID=A0ABN9UQF7_9DINO|nr:unnamed protein product [Polarella glacialis]